MADMKMSGCVKYVIGFYSFDIISAIYIFFVYLLKDMITVKYRFLNLES